MTRCYETTKWFYPYLSLLVLSIQHFARFSALGDVQLTPNVFRISWFLLHLIRKLHCGVLHWDLLLGEAGRAGWRPQGAVGAPRLAGWAGQRPPAAVGAPGVAGAPGRPLAAAGALCAAGNVDLKGLLLGPVMWR